MKTPYWLGYEDSVQGFYANHYAINSDRYKEYEEGWEDANLAEEDDEFCECCSSYN